MYSVILGLLFVYSDDSLVHNSYAVRNTKINTIYLKQTNNNKTTQSKNPQKEKEKKRKRKKERKKPQTDPARICVRVCVCVDKTKSSP